MIAGVLGRAGQLGKVRRKKAARDGIVAWKNPADVARFMKEESDAAEEEGLAAMEGSLMAQLRDVYTSPKNPLLTRVDLDKNPADALRMIDEEDSKWQMALAEMAKQQVKAGRDPHEILRFVEMEGERQRQAVGAKMQAAKERMAESRKGEM